MRVLVTGGAGYLGFSLVRALAHRPETERVVVLDNLARRTYALFVSGNHGPAPVDFVKADVLDGFSLDAALEGIDTVYHLAAHATTPQADHQTHTFDQVNNWGTAQVARAIERSSTVENIIYASSFAVYGHGPITFDESKDPAPVSAYGVSKLAGEAHLRRLADRNVWIARAANVFGFNPAIRFDAVVNAMTFDAVTSGRLRINGDGEQTRPFIDVETLTEALVALPRGSVANGTYNVATNNASINDIADVLTELVPDLDRIYINRDVRMQRITVDLPVALTTQLAIEANPFDVAIAELVDALRG